MDIAFSALQLHKHCDIKHSLCLEVQAVLARQLPPGMLHTETMFDSYEEGDDSLTVRFKDGSEEISARLLIGCDGSQSAVRAQCLADGPPEFLSELQKNKNDVMN